MSEYRKKFLSIWSAMMAEERWHKIDTPHCKPECKGWNSWAPLCDCGEYYCTLKCKGELDKMEVFIAFVRLPEENVYGTRRL